MLKRLDIFTHFISFVTLVIAFYLYVIPACNVVLMMPFLSLGVFIIAVYMVLLMGVIGVMFSMSAHIVPKRFSKYRYNIGAVISTMATVHIMYCFDNSIGSIVEDTPMLFSAGVMDSILLVLMMSLIYITVEGIILTIVTFKRGGVI